MWHGFMCVMIQHIAEHHRRALKPRYKPQGVKIGLHDVIAVSLRPTACGIALGGGHFQIGGQQVVAAMGFMRRVVNKVLRVKALAHQAALHIHQTGQHRINRSITYGTFKSFKCKIFIHWLNLPRLKAPPNKGALVILIVLFEVVGCASLVDNSIVLFEDIHNFLVHFSFLRDFFPKFFGGIFHFRPFACRD